MKNLKRKNTILLGLLLTISFGVAAQKIKTTKTHFSFFSSTPVEDITADNYKTVGTLDVTTGNVVFVVPMQSFEFEKSLMQKHYNSPKFLDTKTYPKGKLVGKITDLSAVNFKTDGTYNVTIAGDMTIHGKTKNVSEAAVITVTGGKIKLNSTFDLTLADYGVAFEDGKPSKSIAKTIEIKVDAQY